MARDGLGTGLGLGAFKLLRLFPPGSAAELCRPVTELGRPVTEPGRPVTELGRAAPVDPVPVLEALRTPGGAAALG